MNVELIPPRGYAAKKQTGNWDKMFKHRQGRRERKEAAVDSGCYTACGVRAKFGCVGPVSTPAGKLGQDGQAIGREDGIGKKPLWTAAATQRAASAQSSAV